MVFQYSKLSHLAGSFRSPQHFTFTRNAIPSTSGSAFNSVGGPNPAQHPSNGAAGNGNAGAGTGGSKWSAGSRASQWGFQQVRLVSQPPTVDPSIRLADDEDDSSLHRRRAELLRPPTPPERKRPSLLRRPRRNSTSLSVVESRVSSVEMHRRYWAAFSQEQQVDLDSVEREADEQPELTVSRPKLSDGGRRSTASPGYLFATVTPLRTFASPAPQARAIHTASTASSPSRPALSPRPSFVSNTPPLADVPRRRRNSTSAVADRPSSPAGTDFLTTAIRQGRGKPANSRQLSREPNHGSNGIFRDGPLRDAITQARQAPNGHAQWMNVKRAVEDYLALPPTEHTSEMHDYCLSSLYATRSRGTSVSLLGSVYTSLFESPHLRPSLQSSRLAIAFFATRDAEVAEDLARLNKHPEKHAQKLARCPDEDHLSTALDIYKSLDKRAPVGDLAFNALLRAAAARGRVELAISLFSRFEESGTPTAETYKILIGMFANAGDKEAIKDVFDSFVQAAGKSFSGNPESVWRATIGAFFQLGDEVAAVGLLDRMLEVIESNPDASLPGHRAAFPKAMGAETLAEVVKGFVEVDDAESSLKWFERVRWPTLDLYLPTIEAALDKKNLHVANTVYTSATANSRIKLLPAVFTSIVEANIAANTPEADQVVAAAIDEFREASRNGRIETHRQASHPELVGDFFPRIIATLAGRGSSAPALAAFRCFASLTAQIVARGRAWAVKTPKEWAVVLRDSTSALLAPSAGLSLQAVARSLGEFNAVASGAGLERAESLELALVNAFLADKVVVENAKALALSQAEWFTIVEAFALTASYEAKGVTLPFDFPGFEPIVDYYFAAHGGAPVDAEDQPDYHVLVHALRESGMPQSRLLAVLSVLNPQVEALVKSGEFSSPSSAPAKSPLTPPASEGELSFEAAPSDNLAGVVPTKLNTAIDAGFFPTPPTTPQPYTAAQPTPPPPSVTISPALSGQLEDLGRRQHGQTAYDVVLQSAAKGIYAHPDIVGKLIELLGREGKTDQARELYLIAYQSLSAFDKDPQSQSLSWVMLEDHMIIGLAHAGALEDVAAHRLRLLQQGSAPSADGYAAMIINMKETTNDAAVALELFEESQRHGVAPNVYLFNTLISKLSRARRAREALEYFELMKQTGLRPTSITYGAVINACCKTGDEQSAEYLFQEMTSYPDFKPRIPPYNTLIQFFVSTKPSRERALYYYDRLLAAGVRPTGHTYKLLLDAYGLVGEADLHSMADVFDALIADSEVEVNGTHWASVLNAWGAAGDLERCLKIFEEIPSHPSTKRSSNLPDAVCYEALLNAMIVSGKQAECGKYIEEMKTRGVRMTAYVANTVIKAHALENDMVAARAVFDSLADPYSGVAAAGNHSVDRHSKQHHGSSSSVPQGVVYREPSTWDAMIRAELSAGELERAKALMSRVEERAFPEAVVEKIRKNIQLAEAPVAEPVAEAVQTA